MGTKKSGGTAINTNWRGVHRGVSMAPMGGRTLAHTKSSGGGGAKKSIRKIWYPETGSITQAGGKGRAAPRVISRSYPQGEAPWTALTNAINAQAEQAQAKKK